MIDCQNRGFISFEIGQEIFIKDEEEEKEA